MPVNNQLKIKILFSICIISIQTFCFAQKKSQDSNDLKNYRVKSAPKNDMMQIDKSCIICIFPNGEQVEKMQKKMGDDYSTVVDDATYYQSLYAEPAQKRDIKVISPDKRYLKFISNQKTVLFDTRAKKSGGWIVIFFRPDSLPKVAGATDAETEMKAYFGR